MKQVRYLYTLLYVFINHQFNTHFYMRIKALLLSAFFLLISCTSANNESDSAETLDFISAPKGFNVEVFSDQVPGARQMAMSPSGVIYVGTRRSGEEGAVYAVVDQDQDFIADTVYTIITGLRMPNGVAYRNGSLYVAATSEVLRFDDIDNNLENPPKPVTIVDDYPTDSRHGWKYIAFGPDDKLYIPVGAPCNICNNEVENPIYASLTRMDADGSNREIIAQGIRNTVGFTWHPETGNLWFTDNGRDWMGDDIPPCELNELTETGQHFGYPYLHGNDVWDPEFGQSESVKSKDFKTPVQELGPHVAPLDILFYTGDMFPAEYKNHALIAEHGSWNRTEKIGYRITKVTFNESGEATSYEPFISGWLQGEEEILGRPVAFLQMNDGSLLVSDDHAGAIYRITYQD